MILVSIRKPNSQIHLINLLQITLRMKVPKNGAVSMNSNILKFPMSKNKKKKGFPPKLKIKFSL